LSAKKQAIMSSAIIHPSTLKFLTKLSKNNNRDWFNANKDEYLQAQADMEKFADALIVKMNVHDQIETSSGKKSLYRIYNDVRFSKDKAPYNPRFAGSLRRTKPELRGGYYYWIKPSASHVGCGFGSPSPEDLKRARLDISDNYKDWKKLLNSRSIKTTFGKMRGSQVATAPKGFDKDHPAIELLRYKQFWFEHSFTDKEVVAENFLDQVNKTFKTIRPFFNYMSEVLTTDLNGESLLKER
jgi:uncharacterized protein (TIGR02453 family)